MPNDDTTTANQEFQRRLQQEAKRFSESSHGCLEDTVDYLLAWARENSPTQEYDELVLRSVAENICEDLQIPRRLEITGGRR
ncbi:MAG TPA: hypothetical protein DEB09_01665 [Candidatus Magasanikbacteria bacterium]|nr:hypothetical protein [Candidatus Magasanikbacteria bacterium]